ncbi:MAG: hypothetical protein IPP13_23750 [Kouleothrix sp.]|jgi:hypothetical protein|nr:hypothetical protein [Kouleothrix sp.]
MDRSRRFRIFHEALAAAARGPFFPDWEFHTLFGLERSEVEQIAFNFAESTEIDGAVRLAINGAMNNLLGYPHGCDNQWHDWLSVTRHELSEIYELWLSDPRSEP